MSERVGKTMIAKAKEVNLRLYLIECYPELIKVEGKEYARLRADSSIVVDNNGYYANNDWQHNRHDSIDFLMKYMDMSFQESVRELCEYEDGAMVHSVSKLKAPCLSVESENKKKNRKYTPPPISENEDDTRLMVQYLKKRGIEMTEEVRQSVHPVRQHGFVNIMFVSRDCRYGELRSAFDPRPPARPFKGKVQGSDEDGYYIVGDSNPETLYVCEAAIDALSLQILYDFEYKSAFASIGGAGCKAAVERLQREYPFAEIIIAFDNDDAGNKAAQAYPFKRHVPEHKDWNEDLVAKNTLMDGPADKICGNFNLKITGISTL